MPESKITTVFRFFLYFLERSVAWRQSQGGSSHSADRSILAGQALLKKAVSLQEKGEPALDSFFSPQRTTYFLLHNVVTIGKTRRRRGAACLRSCARRQTPCSYLRKLPLQQRAMTVLKTCTTISLKQTQCCLHVKITLQIYKNQIPSCKD